MKSTLKVFLAVILFTSATFADGDMTTGGRNCTEKCGEGDGTNTPVTGTVNSNETFDTNNNESSDDTILTLVQNYLFELFG